MAMISAREYRIAPKRSNRCGVTSSRLGWIVLLIVLTFYSEKVLSFGIVSSYSARSSSSSSRLLRKNINNPGHYYSSTRLQLSSQVREPDDNEEPPEEDIAATSDSNNSNKPEWLQSFSFDKLMESYNNRPPFLVEDQNLLLYDIFLLLNLTCSISIWCVHRLEFQYLSAAFSEGCLLSILWIGAGLSNGLFLYSAANGHKGSSSSDDGGGNPKDAGMLALSTFLNTGSLRVILALVVAIAQHRPVGVGAGEELMLQEICFGVVLMSIWRFLHSCAVPRM